LTVSSPVPGIVGAIRSVPKGTGWATAEKTYTARECLRARVLDVLEIQLVPVLFGQGRRFFDTLGPGHIELEPVRALESPSALHLRYEVQYA